MAKKKLVVLTGAGISAESGLKTFRDADGLWEGYDINEVATATAWKRNPALVLEFYNQRRKNVQEANPMLPIMDWRNWKTILMFPSSPRILMTCMNGPAHQAYCTSTAK
jgi:hypothetical protein